LKLDDNNCENSKDNLPPSPAKSKSDENFAPPFPSTSPAEPSTSANVDPPADPSIIPSMECPSSEAPISPATGTATKPVCLSDQDFEDDDDEKEDEQDVDCGFKLEDQKNEGGETPEIIDLTASEDGIIFGTEFEKADLYDDRLDGPNPWHQDLRRELYQAQIIGYNWMIDRHPVGGGLVADKVGCGKVISSIFNR